MANQFYACPACEYGRCCDCTPLMGEDGNEFCDCDHREGQDDR